MRLTSQSLQEDLQIDMKTTTMMEEKQSSVYRQVIAFWLLGFINNISYVIMIAGAEEISNGGIGLVYFFDTFPSLAIKLTGPYWFHLFSYNVRVIMCSTFMAASFILVVYGKGSLACQLLGVTFSGIQAGLGEASFLALSSYYDSQKCLTAWSSGTGAAGVGGYLWVAIWHYGFELSFQWTLMLALVFPVALRTVYTNILHDGSKSNDVERIAMISNTDEDDDDDEEDGETLKPKEASVMPATATLSFSERVRITKSLWPYMLPLFLVYFSEYAMQSGAWAAIGFPVSSSEARNLFYEYAGTAYQVGVFISRSSGTVFKANKNVLFIMPVLQTLLLIFFCIVAAYHGVLYNWCLLAFCLCVGLLGGAVYVNAFTLIASEMPPELVEFSLSAASVADAIGIMSADVVGLLLQGCLYSINNIPGAKIQLAC